MEYSLEYQDGPIIIVREHVQGGYGDPWTGWSCVVEPRGKVAYIKAAPGAPASRKKLEAVLRAAGFNSAKWERR